MAQRKAWLLPGTTASTVCELGLAYALAESFMGSLRAFS